jgi:hypothetical protein
MLGVIHVGANCLHPYCLVLVHQMDVAEPPKLSEKEVQESSNGM